MLGWLGGTRLLVASRTNDRKVAGSRPTKVVCITVLTGNRMGVKRWKKGGREEERERVAGSRPMLLSDTGV